MDADLGKGFAKIAKDVNLPFPKDVQKLESFAL